MAQNNQIFPNPMSQYRPPPYGQRPKGLPLPVINNFQRGENSTQQLKSLRISSADQRKKKLQDLNSEGNGFQQNQKTLKQSKNEGKNHRNSMQSIPQKHNRLDEEELYPGGFPSLCLRKFNNVDLTTNQRNPYKVQKSTDKLLIVRERDREFQDFNKLEKEGLKVHQKLLGSRPNRGGVIKEIKSIQDDNENGNSAALYIEYLKKKGRTGPLLIVDSISSTNLKLKGNLRGNQNQKDELQTNKAKINIFDQQDSTMLKKEIYAKVGNDDQLVPMQNQLQKNEESNSQRALVPFEQQRSKPTDYLMKGKEGKESIEDFINFSRQILRSQISIKQKTEEKDRLCELLEMEQEKLNEALKFQQEDKDRFDQMMKDSEKFLTKAQEDVKKKVTEKQELVKELEDIQRKIFIAESQEKKTEDELQESKKCKKFVDILAILAQRKKPQRKIQNQQIDDLQQQKSLIIKKSQQQQESATFLTQGKEQQSPGKNLKKGSQMNLKNGLKKSLNKMESSDNLNDEDQKFEKDISFSDDYEDDDFENPFDSINQMLAYFQFMEDDNLFKINNIQDEEQAVIKINQNANQKIQRAQEAIDDVMRSIQHLEKSKQDKEQKYKQLKNSINVSDQQQQFQGKNSKGKKKQKNNWQEGVSEENKFSQQKSLEQVLSEMDKNITKENIQKFINISNEIVKSVNSAYDFLEKDKRKVNNSQVEEQKKDQTQKKQGEEEKKENQQNQPGQQIVKKEESKVQKLNKYDLNENFQDAQSYIQTLLKIESNLLDLFEIRFYYFNKEEKNNYGKIDYKNKVKEKESKIKQERSDQQKELKKKQDIEEQQKLQEHQRKIADANKNKVLFKGQPLLPISLKKAVKKPKVQKVVLSGIIKDAKEYLDPEVFEKYQLAIEDHKNNDEYENDYESQNQKINSDLNQSTKDQKLNSMYITNGSKNESIKKSGRTISNNNKI